MAPADGGPARGVPRRLRVAYLPSLLQAGGAEKQMLALAERLPADRFEVEFIALSGAGDYDARARAAGARIRPLGNLPRPGSGLPERLVRRAIKTLRYIAIARQARYDIVDAWLYPADIVAALFRPVTRTPIIISGRRNLGELGGRLGRVDRMVGALAGRMIDAVVANSAAVAAEVVARERVDAAKLRVIRNGVELVDPLASDERAGLRRSLGVAEDEVLLGAVANYRPVKRLDLLIDAFAALAADLPKTRLLLVGEGDLRAELEGQVTALGLGDRVRLHGADLEPAKLVSCMDLVVQASSSEGLPNSLLEGAAAGRAIVATAAGGTGEIVVDGRTGLLVPINDVAALEAALRRAVADPGLRLRLGSAAREHVAATFGMDRYVAEFVSMYEELADARKLLATATANA